MTQGGPTQDGPAGRRLALAADLADHRGSLSDRVAHQVEQLIVGENLRPGDRLPSERELTSRYGVSRTVVRDAIAALEQRGLVTARPGSGIFVCDRSSAAVADVLGVMLRRHSISLPELMETRKLLEVYHAAMAARRAAPAPLVAAGEAIERMRAARGPLEFVEADVAFHEMLGQAAGNRVLAAFLSSLRPLLFDGMLIGTVVEGAREAAIREHAAILAAVEAHDAEAARRLMHDHLRRSYTEWAQAGYIEAASSLFDEE